MGVIRVGGFLALLDVVRDCGIEPRSFIRRAGMNPAVFDDPENVIPYQDLCRLVHRAVEATRCEHLGLMVGARSTIASLGLVGLFTQVHADVGTALRALVRYLHLHDRGAGLSLTASADRACVSYVVRSPAEGADVVSDGAAATIVNVVRALAGPGWRATEVLLPRAPPADSQPYTAFFRAPVRFERAIAGVVFPARCLDAPVRTANAAYQRALERLVGVPDDGGSGEALQVCVDRAIRTLILTGRPTIDTVAAACGLTTRTLSRRLAGEGTSFRKRLEHTRFALARHLLAGSDQSVECIALSLGYAEPAAFMHAFRRWSGTPPARFRRAVRFGSRPPVRRPDEAEQPDS